MAKNGLPAIEKERLHFTALLASNPFYFDTLSPGIKPTKGAQLAVSAIKGNTGYEQIGCVGYNPVLELLEATVSIKRAFGYGGDLCANGSTEFIRFYVDSGGGWVDAGLTSFNAHDFPDGTDCAKKSIKPLNYAVSLPFMLRRRACFLPQLPRVRAILSWQWMPPPNQPNWHPVWGNVVDRSIQIASGRFRLFDLLSSAQVKLPFDISHLELQEIDLPLPPILDTAKLAKLYMGDAKADQKVEPHRFGFLDAHAQLTGATIDNVAALASKFSEYKQLGIDWGAVIGQLVDMTKGDVSFEELTCVALDYNREWVVANFQMKRASGYSGGPCTAGSLEYVAFWVDWDDTCDWTYLGTVQQRVHDYAIPRDGLHYWVGLPARLAEHRRNCKEPKAGRVRAVLSWNALPSTTDPDAVPHWGNRLDTHIEIQPRKVVGNLPLIDTLGGVSLTYIDTGSTGLTVANGKFAETGALTDPWIATRNCAFGGDVRATAEVPAGYSAAGYQYRLMVRKAGDPGAGTAVTGSFAVTKALSLGGGTTTVYPGSNGWTPYLHPDLNIYSNIGNWSTAVLGTPDRNHLWEIRLERRDAAAVPNGSTAWYRLQLDNEPPVVSIQIDTGGIVQDCNDFNQGTDVTGHFRAFDPQGHFGVWSLDTTPNSLSPPDPVANPSLLGTSPTTTLMPGHGWTISPTLALSPCGYVVTVRAWDNTIVGSSQNGHNYAEDDTGFCLRLAT